MSRGTICSCVADSAHPILSQQCINRLEEAAHALPPDLRQPLRHGGLPCGDLVAGHTAAGRTIRRVHTVHASRLTAYLRWECTSQATTNVAAGEDIRVADLDRHPELAADEDVWIFDDAVGVKMWQPTPDGAKNGVARATAAELDAYRAWQADAWRVAIPLPRVRRSDEEGSIDRVTPADPSPESVARRRLAEQLRALRVAAGLSTTQLAHRLGWSQAKVSRIETATHGVAPGDVRTWAEALDTPAARVEELVELSWTASIEVRNLRRELAAGHAGAQAAVGRIEQQATRLRSVQHLVVPGLLQTRDYALALFRRAHPAGRDAEQAADARLTRQHILDDPARWFEWVITEAVLWWRPADWATQVEQLRAVATATTRPNVDLRILPLDVQAPTFYHSFILHDDYLVTAESIGEIQLNDPDEIAWQIEAFTRLQQAALDPAASRDLLHGLAARFATR